MYKITQQKTVILLIALSACIIFTLAFLFLNNLSVKQNNLLISHTEHESKRAIILQDIVANIGYGGFIHNYKNGILRKDINTIEFAQKQILRAQEAVDIYVAQYPLEPEIVNNIKQTLDIYFEKSELAKQLILQGLNAEEIDQQVKVDDTLALLSLSRLLTSARDLSTFVLEDSAQQKSKFSTSLWITLTSLLLIIILLFIYIELMIKQNLLDIQKNKLIFTLAPIGILVIDDNGFISSANAQAMKMFKLTQESLTNLTVDQLTPENVRANHKHYREEFQSSDRTAPMEGRGRQFLAQRTNGEVFPASISIATYSQNDKKEAIVIIKDLTEELLQITEANTDKLTKLANRRAIDDALQKAIAQAQLHKTELYLALIDIDFFKRINDQHGHSYGDQILINIAKYIKSAIRETDFIGRWGGEEFLLIIEKTSAEKAYDLCEKIRQHIELSAKEHGYNFTVSIGLSPYHQNQHLNSFFDKTDEALYCSKNNGRNCTTLLAKETSTCSKTK